MQRTQELVAINTVMARFSCTNSHGLRPLKISWKKLVKTLLKDSIKKLDAEKARLLLLLNQSQRGSGGYGFFSWTRWCCREPQLPKNSYSSNKTSCSETSCSNSRAKTSSGGSGSSIFQRKGCSAAASIQAGCLKQLPPLWHHRLML
jgi:hypothetical protein